MDHNIHFYFVTVELRLLQDNEKRRKINDSKPNEQHFTSMYVGKHLNSVFYFLCIRNSLTGDIRF